MPCRVTQDRRVMVESSDKTWSTGEGNGKPFQYSCLENPMNSMERQKDKPYIYIYLGKLALLSIYYFKKLKKTFQVRILEWVAIPFSKDSSRPRDWTQVFQTWRQILYHLSHLGSPKKTKHLKKRLLEYSVNSRNYFTQLFTSAEPRTWDHKTT